VADLIVLPYSPWSEKTWWALDHHRIPYRLRSHIPLLGEVSLRLRLRRINGPASVPAFVDGATRLCDSFAIACHAEAIGSGSPLIPQGSLEAVTHWNAVSDRCISATRALAVQRILQSPEAQAEHLPPLLPGAVRRPLAPMARMGMAFLMRKHRFSLADERGHLDSWRRHRRCPSSSRPRRVGRRAHPGCAG
jgi:glutathione S-transferase